MPHHGVSTLRGIEYVPCSPFHAKDRFGRLFPSLPGLDLPRQTLLDLAASMREPANQPQGNSATVNAGFTFLGQFIDHDITLDTTSSLERLNDPAATRNFRTPLLELDNVYGSGPDVDPYLYDQANKGHLLTGTDDNPNDLARNKQGRALIGDPRNDENGIVSQLQLAFLRFHNRVFDLVKAGGLPCTRYYASDFTEAQRLVRWHYQWIIVHEFLPLIIDADVLESIEDDDYRCYFPDLEPFIPVEFAVAVYRFGHSQIRSRYTLRSGRELVQLFKPPADALTAFEPVPKANVIDWAYFFKTKSGVNPLPSRKIDTLITKEVFELPFIMPPDERSLAARNLLRGQSFSLPSGEMVACFLGEEPLTPAQIGVPALAAAGMGTPLWYYILKEAELHPQNKLGAVGGRIVAEVLLGILAGDANSYRSSAPCWKPCLPAKKKGEFGIADLLKLASEAA
jgi:Animal haem peroxidase